MRTYITFNYFVVGLLSVLWGCGYASALPVGYLPVGDVQPDRLEKIDRTIVKEPTYEKSPLYCVLVFGANPKMRIWVAVSGDALYVDLNGNGDLTDKGEAFRLTKQEGWGFSPRCDVGDILDLHTKLMHKKLSVGLVGGDIYRLGLDVSFDDPNLPRLHGFAQVSFARKPADAPIVHFGGPMTMGLSMATVEDRPAFICAEIGTVGVGKGSFVYYTRSICDAIDPKLKPDLQVEYTTNKKVIVTEKATFYKDKIEHIYIYPVLPGEKGDKRQVTISLSFPDWKDGKVVPRMLSGPLVTLEK
jgi:hypothetical protein